MDNQIIDLLRAASRHFQTQMKEKIALSDTGLSTFQAQLKEIRQQLATEVLGHLPPTEKQALQTLLSKVINQA